jgi:hypothetical protein
MRKPNQMAFGSEVYALVHQSRMSESERHAALSAMRNAEAIVDAIVWVKGRISALGNYFLKPSLKN